MNAPLRGDDLTPAAPAFLPRAPIAATVDHAFCRVGPELEHTLLRVSPGVPVAAAAEHAALLLDTAVTLMRRVAADSYDSGPGNCAEAWAAVYLAEIAQGVFGGLGGNP